MLTALDRDTPRTKNGLTPHNLPMQEPTTIQEPPWLWFTLPELGFPLLTDEYRRPINPETEEYMRRYVPNVQDGNRLMMKTVGESTIRNLLHKSEERSRP